METLPPTPCKHCASMDHTTENHEQSDAIAAFWTTYLEVSGSDDPEDEIFAEEMIEDTN